MNSRNSPARIAMFHRFSLNQRLVVCACAALAPLLLAAAVSSDLTVVAAIIASAVLLGVSLWLLRGSLRRDASGLVAFLHGIAAGDLRRDAGELNDRVDDTVLGAEAVAAKMSVVIGQVKSDSVVISLEGAALLTRTRELSDRTDRQSSSMQKTVAAVHELATSVARSVESVHQVDRLSSEVQVAAHSGQAMMAGAAAGMTRIDASASRVASVVSVIDRIAFQTNLLALNASVEAARAGEAGRGFSVVATEVRLLSQQCSQAAREVGQAIETCAADVRSGLVAMRDAEARLAEIAAHIGALASQSHAIAAVTQQQSGGLEQIRAAMVDIDAATQQNAQLAEVMTRAARLLTIKAEKLADTVAFAKLRQGTADEAYALVLRAIARVEEVGQERAFAEFHDRTAGFIDRDLYLIVADRTGRYLAFGARPDMVGRHMTDLPDFDAEGFLRDACEQVDLGGGWVEFQVVHPQTRVLLDKVSYFTALEPDMLIGCGVFRQ